MTGSVHAPCAPHHPRTPVGHKRLLHRSRDGTGLPRPPAERGHGYNLPMDPRPTLNAVAQEVADNMEKAGLRAKIVKNPDPYGFGGAFRKDRWFAITPNYQDPGTSELAPDPGIRLDRPAPRKITKPARDPEAPLTPTRTWPQVTRWLSSSICRGEKCQYEPKSVQARRWTRSGCDVAWSKHSRTLFESFMNSNPGTMFRDMSVGCIKEIEPSHRGHNGSHRAMAGEPIDHAQLCRLPDGQRFIISQPYCRDGLCKSCLDQMSKWQAEMPALTWITAGKERAWYFPNNANLLVLGTRKALDSLKLNYEVPEDTQPVGCIRFPTHLQRNRETSKRNPDPKVDSIKHRNTHSPPTKQ